MAVHLALSSDHETVWRGGRLDQNGATPEDDRRCPLYGFAYEGADPPRWISESIAVLDDRLPQPSLIAEALAPGNFILPLDPAVARIPASPQVSSAGLCLLGCRLLLACRERAIPPAFDKKEDAIAKVEDASLLVVLTAGSGAVEWALSALENPIFRITPVIQNDFWLEFGDNHV